MLYKLYTFFLIVFKPIILLFSKVYISFSKKKVTGRHYFIYRDLIEVGTVLLTKTNGEATNLFNPVSKEIKHAGLYLGYIDGIPTVIEARLKGVQYTDLVTFLTTKDRVIGLKPTYFTKEDKIFTVSEAAKFIGMKYDFLFRSSNKAFYCFELIAEIFKSVRPSVILKTSEVIKGYHVYDEGTFLNDERFFITFDSKDLENE